MTLQLQILSDVVQRERAEALSPDAVERRRAAHLLAALQCCMRASWGDRLRAAIVGRTTSCCSAA